MPMSLHGRREELEAIRRLLDAAERDGTGGSLLLLGDPGIGKTALLDAAAREADAAGMRVLRATGIESEAELPFAALQMLLAPDLGAVRSALPAPQLQALETAFGMSAPSANGSSAADASAGNGSAGTPPASQRLVTGLAVLSALTELAAVAKQPVVCLIDDAHWVDRASADAVLIAMRRLQRDPVVVLAAAWPSAEDAAEGVPVLRLGPLAPADAAALLDERAAGLPPAARSAVLREAQGNPLALTELPRADRMGHGHAAAHPDRPDHPDRAGHPVPSDRAEPFAGGDHADPSPDGTPPLTRRLQLAFLDRAQRLPSGTRALLTTAALEEDGDLAAVLRATRLLHATGPAPETGADPLTDLRAALDAELVSVEDGPGGGGDRLRFHHPLLRAALRRQATVLERRRAHDALAAVLDGERRAWHRALAADAPDESVAADLERTALTARARGGHAAAAAAYQQSARLSTRPDRAAQRLTLAAESALAAGRFTHARLLAAEAAETADAAGQAPEGTGRASEGIAGQAPEGTAGTRARAEAVHAAARFSQGEYPSAHQLLLDAAAAPAPPPLAARLLLQDVHVAWYLGAHRLAETASALDALPPLPPGDPTGPLVGYVRSALRGVLDSFTPAAEPGPGRESAAVPPPPSPSPPPPPPIRETVLEALRLGADLPRDLVQVCGTTLAVGDDATTHEFAAELLEAARAQGADGLLPTVLFFLAEAELFHGRHRDALADATEALRVAEETGQRQWTGQLHGLLAYLAALDGDAERCRAAADRARSAPGGDGPTAPGDSWALWALGLLDLGAGRAEDALSRLLALATGPHGHTVAATHAVPDLVEAAVRLGRPEAAAEPLARFERWAAFARQAWADALVQRCRALLAPDESAEAHHLAARDGVQPLHRPFEHARSTLLYGEWLRRARRRSEAQAQLRRALEGFERLGAVPWARRAATELRAAGGTGEAAGAKNGSATEDLATADLTPQELQVVRLAARGLSNRDIAARLFLSPRTVGHHLYKAYPKLGVSSRTELAGLLA
ncbi:helix-turn-helix transcriptional regulator [Phaeacidiphilus oryzae]|uniref:helix-turn-helix transcriptional regulator n=1 Tax=Phaeacidiphilus oryzae TaxID=348818 RepID=UPI00056047F8|nr:LuxR family transcriptional regulator [Phaeacidiphilus oryzae]